MEPRKLIGFGTSTHVISLPKSWITKHQLTKGDFVYLNTSDDHSLIITPSQHTAKKEPLTKHIDTTSKNLSRIQREIISAYVNNYDLFHLTGKNLNAYKVELEKVLTSLIALEIIEHDDNHLLAKDFTAPTELSLPEMLRKIDFSVRTSYNTINTFKGDEDLTTIISRNETIKKFRFLAMRTIKYSMAQPASPAKTFELLAAWDFIHVLKVISGHHKNIGRQLNFLNNPTLKKELIKLHKPLEQLYLDTLIAYHKKNIEKAYDLSLKKRELIKTYNKYLKRNWEHEHVPNLIELYKQEAVALHTLILRLCN